MLDEIRAYWDEIKTEYEKRYNQVFLSDFESSKKYLERMKSYLLAKQKECPSDVDVVCTLASVELELREDKFDYIEFLDGFLNEFENFLENDQKARIYTDMAFWDDFSKDSLKYFNKAEDLNSPFAETYTGLGLYYFSEYEFSGEESDLSISHHYFKIAREMDENYVTSLNYAVSLYELKEYEKAKKNIFRITKKAPG